MFWYIQIDSNHVWPLQYSTGSNRYADTQSHADRFRVPQRIIYSMRKSICGEVLNICSSQLQIRNHTNLRFVVSSEIWRRIFEYYRMIGTDSRYGGYGVNIYMPYRQYSF